MTEKIHTHTGNLLVQENCSPFEQWRFTGRNGWQEWFWRNGVELKYGIRWEDIPHWNVYDGTVDFDIEEMREWCDENCKGEHDVGRYTAVFEFEDDALRFVLRWI